MGAKAVISTTLAVLILVAAIDIWLNTARPMSRVPTASLERGEVFNAMAALKQESRPPEVIVLGSSLVTAPVMQAEAATLQRPVPRMTHRHSTVLEQALGRHFGYRPSVFCLAVGGEMVSDAYFIVTRVLESGQRPAAIVYGIAPRDFQDNLLPGIESSETFQTLSRLEDLPEFIFSDRYPLERKADMVIGRLWTLWRYKSDIKTCLTLRLKKTMEQVMPWVVFDKYGETLELKPRKRGQFPEEAKGTPHAFPNLPLEHISFAQARFEYIRRYNPPNDELIDSQFQYLDRLLALARKAGVGVLVINMPLSDFNRTLMPPGFYARYKQRLAQACRAGGADLADLATQPWGSESNYVDGVHITPRASRRFLAEVGRLIASSPVSLALKGNDSLATGRKGKESL